MQRLGADIIHQRDEKLRLGHTAQGVEVDGGESGRKQSVQFGACTGGPMTMSTEDKIRTQGQLKILFAIQNHNMGMNENHTI